MAARNVSDNWLGSPGPSGPSIGDRAPGPDTPGAVWVLEDTSGGAEPCLAIAERLGVEFRRVPLRWDWRGALAPFARHGSLAGLLSPLPLAAGPPALTLSAGHRAAAIAAWLKAACGSRMVHFGAAGRHTATADLRVLDTPHVPEGSPPALALLGPPHRVSGLALQAARSAWADRLSHLPRPLLTLLVGTGPFGAPLQAGELYRLAAGLAEALHTQRGAILAASDRRIGREATDALASGLSRSLHILHRENEPGPNPELGFLAMADAVVVAGHAGPRLLRACAAPVPVYVTQVGPMAPAEQRLHKRLREAGQIKPLEREIGTWPRAPLDEAQRAAASVHALLTDVWRDSP